MTRSHLARIATVATICGLALSPLTAIAQNTPPATPPGFAAIDTDGDGSISAAEWQAMAERLGPRMRVAADGTPGPDHAARAAAMVRLFDTDADGLLSAEEIESGLVAMATLRGPGGDRGRDGMRERDGDRRGDMRGEMRGERMERGEPRGPGAARQ